MVLARAQVSKQWYRAGYVLTEQAKRPAQVPKPPIRPSLIAPSLPTLIELVHPRLLPAPPPLTHKGSFECQVSDFKES